MTSTTARTTGRFPEPPALPLVGHALTVPRGADGLLYMIRQAKKLGPLYRIRVLGEETIVASGLDVVTELSDETRFRKHMGGATGILREPGGDGLVTAHDDEPNWRKAHDILMPAFSLGAMRDYHTTMLKVARDLTNKWDRAAELDLAVDVPEDATRLTLDTIGLCGFGYDFESFQRDEPHLFVKSMNQMLAQANHLNESLPGTEHLQPGRTAQFRDSIATLHRIVDEVIQHRRVTRDTSTGDLLGRMLHTTDEVTGEPLDDTNVRYQVLTFLIAGHETTSGLLSFALYMLTKHPEALARAQAEVDALWGDTDQPEPTHGDVGKLTYMRQVLDESLRLWPSAIGHAVEAREDTVIGGKYPVRKGQHVLVLHAALHRQPEWGDNVELFDPERFSPEREAERPVHLFKPFGNGQRACIGRQFALHEATMVLALLVHRYRLIDHADYRLRLVSTITVRPTDFTLRLRRRTTADRRRPAVTSPAPDSRACSSQGRAAGTALTVLHGSNLGTSAGIARDLASDADTHGFTATAAALDSVAGRLTGDSGPLVIVASSYNGEPTDDAARFVSWLDELQPGSLDGLTYAVLGVGDRNWAATYQRIPALIDERLTAAGATSLLERGVADAAGDFAGAVDRWTADLWNRLLDRYGAETCDEAAPEEEADSGEPLYVIEDAPETPGGRLARRHGLRPMDVLESRELVDMEHPLGRSKRFVKLRLPEGVTYRTGDHLAVLPRNPDRLVRRVAHRFTLDLDRTVRLRARRRTRDTLPVDGPLTLRELLTDVVELQDAVTREQVGMLRDHTSCPPERGTLAELAAAPEDTFREQVTDKRISLLDLLEQHRACELPFERFLELLPLLRPRHYSISSSSAVSPGELDLMVSLVAAPHRSGEGTFYGIASHHLHTLHTGDTVQARVLPCRDVFRLPEDTSVPVVLVSAGTGLAPFRGAVLDRLHAGADGTMLCYFGCDHPDVDYLHRDELEEAERAGAVSLRPTFMHAPSNGARFVQDRILQESGEIWAVLEAGGRVYVCGDGGRMAPGVRKAFQSVYSKHTGADADQAARWMSALIESGVYVEDVWAP
ncbi:cytochrome P450 [Streptomyces heilongjiangensis]|uniref:Bifunctional cytochrome P450/NADPH--P450 reductase n=1 Tax=Streptomyces heilongjiangensis TaxID=945052 RepID=A0ABW1BKH4_9ACTN|nr:cytochrome P450 [Streptomyces heilongjiangensis]MDC2952451.1 cytochrome P450 [Streptomyces heilongjiangensis]